ncbi:MAG: hypothetical protein WCK34_10700 [Bacteroidota bacterium]
MIALPVPKNLIRPAIIDIVALLLIYLAPTVSHFSSVPLYMIEPMRLVLILAIVHTSKQNALLLAFTLPFFSFLVSGHPQVVKAMIISAELIINVLIFYKLAERINIRFLSMLLAILFSKIICYLLYWAIFSWSFVIGESEPVFLLAQGITTMLFSIYPLLIKITKKNSG